MTQESFVELLSEIEKNEGNGKWASLGNINEQSTLDKLLVCRELMKKGLIEFRKPIGGAIMGNRDGSRAVPDQSENNLEAKLTPDGRSYLVTFRNESLFPSESHDSVTIPPFVWMIGGGVVVLGALLYFIS